jgi:hypothetical protein
VLFDSTAADQMDERHGDLLPMMLSFFKSLSEK